MSTTSARPTNETRTERVARRLRELTANEFTGEDWKKARDMMRDENALSAEDRRSLEEIIIGRNYASLQGFLKARPATPPPPPALKGLKVFWSSMFALLFMAVTFPLAVVSSPVVFVYHNAGHCLRASWRGVKRVVEGCGWLLVWTFLATTSLVWYIFTKGAWFLFDRLMNLFASVFFGKSGKSAPDDKEQCRANHTGSTNQTKPPAPQDPACCAKQPVLDFAKYLEKTPAARQMLLDFMLAEVQPEIAKRVDVWTPKIVAEQNRQAGRIQQLEKDMKTQYAAVEAKVNEYKATVQGVQGLIEAGMWMGLVYVGCKVLNRGLGNTRFLDTPGAAQLRAATHLADTRLVLNAALNRAANDGVQQVAGWMSWNSVQMAGNGLSAAVYQRGSEIMSIGAAFARVYLGSNTTYFIK